MCPGLNHGVLSTVLYSSWLLRGLPHTSCILGGILFDPYKTSQVATNCYGVDVSQIFEMTSQMKGLCFLLDVAAIMISYPLAAIIPADCFYDVGSYEYN